MSSSSRRNPADKLRTVPACQSLTKFCAVSWNAVPLTDSGEVDDFELAKMFRNTLKLASALSFGDRRALLRVGTFLMPLASATTESVLVVRNLMNCHAASALRLLREMPMTLPTTYPEP